MSDPREEMFRLATEAACAPPSADGTVADWRAWTDRQAAWQAWCMAHPRVVGRELLHLQLVVDRAEPLLEAAHAYVAEMNRAPRFDGGGFDLILEQARARLLDAAQEYSNG